MSVIKGILSEEKERNIMMQNQYLKEISALPRGCIAKKSKKSGDYYYLVYRKGDKVIYNYLGKASKEIDEVRYRIEKRKHLEGLVKNLKSELRLIEKVVK